MLSSDIVLGNFLSHPATDFVISMFVETALKRGISFWFWREINLGKVYYKTGKRKLFVIKHVWMSTKGMNCQAHN